MSTAPWSTEWPDILASGQPVREHVELSAIGGTLTGPATLGVERLSVSLDEAWVPHVQCRAQITAPDAATLDALDPRAGVRLVAAVGYSTPGLADDVHQLASLALRTRASARPAGTVNLSAASDEAIVDDGVVGAAEDAAFDRTGVNEYVASVLDAAFSGPRTIASDYPAAYRPDLVEEPIDAYDSPMPRLSSLLDPIDGAVYCGPDRVWYIRPRRVVTTTPEVILRTGPTGLATRLSFDTSREDSGTQTGWANELLVVYTWRETESRPAGQQVGYAKVTDGPYAAFGSNRRTMVIRKGYYSSAANAGQAAAAILRRAFTRGRTQTITAPAMPWLRPGDTVGFVDGIGGEPDRLLISRIEFEWPGSTMTLNLRRPETGTITIGE